MRSDLGPSKRSERSTPTILGIIAARGGSKAIPRKNLAVLANKPLIAWTVEVAIQSDSLDRLVISTDDPEIAEVGKKLGAEVPFLRPGELATDTATSMDVILHAIRWFDENESYRPDYILLLQPTSPLRTVTDIHRSIELVLAKRADSVVSVCETRQHPLWMKGVNEEGKLVDLYPQSATPTRRQDLQPLFALNGAIYLGRDKQIGSVAPGKNADLVIVKGDPSKQISEVENVEIVFKDGVGYDSQKLLDAVRGRYGQY